MPPRARRRCSASATPTATTSGSSSRARSRSRPSALERTDDLRAQGLQERRGVSRDRDDDELRGARGDEALEQPAGGIRAGRDGVGGRQVLAQRVQPWSEGCRILFALGHEDGRAVVVLVDRAAGAAGGGANDVGAPRELLGRDERGDPPVGEPPDALERRTGATAEPEL